MTRALAVLRLRAVARWRDSRIACWYWDVTIFWPRRAARALAAAAWPAPSGRHCPSSPAPEGALARAPRPVDPPRDVEARDAAVRAGATDPAPRGAVRAGQATGPAAVFPWQPEEAAHAPARLVLPAPVPDFPGRGEHPYGGILAVRHLGMPPWEPARYPDGPEPAPRRPRLARTGNTGALRTVSWSLERGYWRQPSCAADRAGWASAAHRRARLVTA